MLAQKDLGLVRDLVGPCLVKGNMYPSVMFVTLKYILDKSLHTEGCFINK